MQIELTPEQDDVVRHAIAAGRIAQPEEAVAQAMAEWVERERQRAALIASLDDAEASILRGEGLLIESDEDLEALFAGIQAETRARLASDP